jgi:hypothetical protein
MMIVMMIIVGCFIGEAVWDIAFCYIPKRLAEKAV